VKNKNMKFERHLDITRAENKEIETAGDAEIKIMRTVYFKKGDIKMTLTGGRDKMDCFSTGDNVKVIISNSQSELFKVEEQELEGLEE